MEDLGLRNGDHGDAALKRRRQDKRQADLLAIIDVPNLKPIDIDVIFMKNWDPLLSESSTASTPSGYSLSYSSSSSLASSPSSSGGSDSPCSWEKDWNDVRSVSRAIGISTDKVKMVDLSKEYWNRVFEPSINVWERGGTPNPDVDCNREIKFGALLDVLPNRPRHFLATGHYGRIDRPGHSTDRDLNQPQARLVRAKDSNKDQTYYLSQMNDVQLSRTILPLGRLTKTEVRQLATHWNLPNHSKEESMGVCFIGERGRFGDFIAQYTTPPEIQGRLVLPSGEVVGTHDGLWYYTIGQRAKIANQPKPLFVAKKGVGENGQDILVVPGSDHPLLSCSAVLTDAFHWIHGTYPADLLENDTEGRINVRVRHRMKPVPATIMLSPGKGAQGG
ncbi:tRNA (5-methylaminomethyl-2-thiouridylate)-methyltransferase [Kwoniella heveanensis CBS 569]|nr:tRNA (5-methylaminomethyl-2-thiouridylate)-methyltransferase [Kwoniella heveanensis CBS 569]